MIWYPTVNCESRGGRPPVAIILHRTDGPWEAAWSWFLYDKSCASYREYARLSSRGAEQHFRQYLEDFGADDERSDRVLAGLPEE